jgi:hypothetical protein
LAPDFNRETRSSAPQRQIYQIVRFQNALRYQSLKQGSSRNTAGKSDFGNVRFAPLARHSRDERAIRRIAIIHASPELFSAS